MSKIAVSRSPFSHSLPPKAQNDISGDTCPRILRLREIFNNEASISIMSSLENPFNRAKIPKKALRKYFIKTNTKITSVLSPLPYYLSQLRTSLRELKIQYRQLHIMNEFYDQCEPSQRKALSKVFSDSKYLKNSKFVSKLAQRFLRTLDY